ncbi:flavodoxin domain-containing protein [Mycoplasma sp. P36-A1]|uniref:flavodoxin domain-containing protein n=1 Tax=Mycoplasma sp. P36-A1 TaxID=3252900 RepID=UPI003C2E2BFF
MEKILIAYFTTTGNTQSIAEAFNDAIKDSAEVTLVEMSDDLSIEGFDKYMFGSPAQGTEVTDDTVFDPFMEKNIEGLKNKKVALFGSFGWGGGEYMTTFADKIKADGVNVFDAPFTVLEAPDQEAIDAAMEYANKFLSF